MPLLTVIKDLRVADLYLEHTCQATVAKYSPSGFYVASGGIRGVYLCLTCCRYTRKRSYMGYHSERAYSQAGDEGKFYNLIVGMERSQALSGPVLDIAWSSDNQRIAAVGDGKEKYFVFHCECLK